MKKIIICFIICLAIGLAGFAIFELVRPAPESAETPAAGKTSRKRTVRIVDTVEYQAVSRTPAGEPGPGERDRADLAVFEDTVDEDNYEKLRPQVLSLIGSKDPQTRLRVAEELKFVGPSAAPDLVTLLADGDDAVREAANDSLVFTLRQEESEPLRLATIRQLMEMPGLLTEDTLTLFEGELDGMEDQSAVLIAAVETIQKRPDSSAAETMRSVYEFVASEPYTDAASAQSVIARLSI